MSHTYELLDKTLRPAGEDYESQVVYMDSCSGLIDPAVAELIESRGHVLLVHVGGTTVDEQPHDTNLRTRDSPCTHERNLPARMKDLEITYGLCMAGPGCDAGRLYSYLATARR